MLWIALPFPQLQKILMEFIGTFFLSFMSPITIGDVGLPVRGSMWVYTHVPEHYTLHMH